MRTKLFTHAVKVHMGQFLQGGKNGRLMSFFFKRRASVWSLGVDAIDDDDDLSNVYLPNFKQL